MRKLAPLLFTVLTVRPITATDESPLKASDIVVCRRVVDASCQGTDLPFSDDTESVAFLTRIEGSTGDAYVEHIWFYGGKESRRVRLVLRGSPYRTWSTKRIKGMPGSWRVEVVDPVGRSLGAVDFSVKPTAP